MNCTIALFINIHRAALYSNKYTLRRWTIHKFHSADRCRLTADCAYYFVLNFCRRTACNMCVCVCVQKCNTFEDALAQWRGSQRTQSHIGLQTHAHTTITHMNTQSHKCAHNNHTLADTTITHMHTQLQMGLKWKSRCCCAQVCCKVHQVLQVLQVLKCAAKYSKYSKCSKWSKVLQVQQVP